MVAKPTALSQHSNAPSLHYSITPRSIDTEAQVCPGIPYYRLSFRNKTEYAKFRQYHRIFGFLILLIAAKR